MRKNPFIVMAGMFLATLGTAFGQPIITTQPQNQGLCSGTSVTFTVGATGVGPLSFQWQRDPGGAFIDLPGETNATLVRVDGEGSWYRAVVRDSSGTTTSDAAYLAAQVAPLISQPAGHPTNWPGVSLGAGVANRVLASGTGPLTYQWYLNGTPIPGQTKYSISLTDVQSSQAGDYTAVVGNTCGSVTSAVVTLKIDPTFIKITQGPLVEDRETSTSGAWGDYDNDGFVDVLVANGGQNALYHNKGGSNFTRMTTGPAATDSGRLWGAAWADYDNDGYVDLVAAYLKGGLMAQRLYHNNEGRDFTAVVDPALQSDTAPATCAWWFDYNKDGFLDLFVSKGVPYGGAAANDCLFQNKGDGTFRKMTGADVGHIVNDQKSTEICWSVDYNNDGNQEVMAQHVVGTSSYTAVEACWRLQPDGTFASDPGLPAGVFPGFWGDYNNDGWLDVLALSEGNSVQLFSNLAGNGFTNATADLHITTPISSYLAAWGDYDNDGWLDLFYVGAYWLNPLNGMFRNNGDGTFTQVLSGSPVNDGENRTAPNWVDYDNDGCLDLFVAVGDGVMQKNRLYRNSGNTNHWLKVKLDGRASNRSGIGARVHLQATINGRTFWQMREISCGSGYPQQNGLVAHFGLGDATTVTTLRLEWPSGIVQELQNVPANQFLTVSEHQEYGGPAPGLTKATTTANGLRLSILEPAAPTLYALEASTNLVNWTKLLARTSTGATFDYTDKRAASYRQRFYRVVVP